MKQTLLDKYGRKFLLSLFAMVLGAAVSVYGISSAQHSPEAAPSIASMVTAFSGIIVAASGLFSIANAYITGKQGPEQKSTVVSTTEVTHTGPAPNGDDNG